MNHESNNRCSARKICSWALQHPLLLIILVSVFLRVAVAIAMGNTVVELPGIFDQISYHNLAIRVANGYGFSFGVDWWPITPANAPTAHWSFLYTTYLTVIYLLFGPYPIIGRILQAIIVGVLHPIIAYKIGESLFTRRVGLVSAAVTAVYIYFFYYAGALMTEPFYITAILFSLFIGMRLAESKDKKRDIQLGIALGISIGITLLLRQVFLLFLPFLFLWIWLARHRQNRKHGIEPTAGLPVVATVISLILIVLMILPVTLYNYSRFHRFVMLNTNSGYAFFWGNHPIYGTKFIPILPRGTYQRLIPKEVRHLDEVALEKELLQRGMQFVIDDPMRYLLLSLSRIPPYFMFWYSDESGLLSNISRIGSFGIMLPFMVYGLVLGIKKKISKTGSRLMNLVLSPIGLLAIFVVVYSGVHILTWTLIRYRLPVDAVMIPFAGLALVDIAERIKKRRPRIAG